MVLSSSMPTEWIMSDSSHSTAFFNKGIQECIINEREINNDSNGIDFYMRNGRITTEICLACALHYFAGGRYLDITVSHGIGKTDLYHSIWAVVHATNVCTMPQFNPDNHI